jgi:tetratricopeptide (TPR) repeat protein
MTGALLTEFVYEDIGNPRSDKSMKIITDLHEFMDPEMLLPAFYAMQNGYIVEVITGPNFYAKPRDYKERYPKAIELSDGFELNFVSSNRAIVKKVSCEKEVKEATGREAAQLLTALAEKNKKPILYHLAANACLEAIKTDCERFDLMSLLSHNCYKDLLFHSSVKYAEKALALAKADERAGASSDLGFFYSKIGNYEDSIKVLEKGMESNDKQKYIHNNLATTHHILAAKNGKKKNFYEAGKHYEKELENTPNHPYAASMLESLIMLEKLMK